MKKIFNIFLGLLETALILYVVTITTCLLLKNDFGYTQFGDYLLISVDKENQYQLEDFEKGDLVILEEQVFDGINEKDVLYYLTVENEEYVINKGVVETKTGDRKNSLYTFEGTERVVQNKRILGKFQGTIFKNMGGVLNFLESTIGFLLFVILPIFVLFIYHIYNLIIVIKYGDELDELEEKMNSKELKEA